MKAILKKYEVFLKRRGLLPRGEEYYMWHAKKFFEYTGAKIVDFGDVKKFQKKYDIIILRESLCNDSKKKHLKCARIFADFLIEERKIFENAPRKIKPPRVQTRLPIPVEERELCDVFVAIERRWTGFLALRNKTIMQTLLGSGLRRGELINLKRRDVFPDHIIVRSGKGDKDRIVYIPSDFYKKIENYIKATEGKSEYMFFSLRNEKMSIRAMSRIFEIIKQETGLEKFHAHKMRSTYATQVLEQGISITVLRDQLGHTNIATTNRYLAVSNRHRKESMERLKVVY